MVSEGNNSVYNLDETDIKILKALQKNGKLTTKELAEEVNLSTSPVHERQKRLEQAGFIEGYRAIVNPKKMGLGMSVLCNIRLKQHSKELGRQFIEAINGIDEVVECWNTSGEYDFMMKLMVRDMEHYQHFVLDTLGTIESIGSLNTIFIIGEIKKNGGIPI